jgi:glycosyltransferase involved in cell wall biosynthesis
MAGRRVTNLTSTADQTHVPKLSVIVASLNGQNGLKDCLDSILADESADAEIIVTSCGPNVPIYELSDRYGRVNFVQFPQGTQLPVLLAEGIARSHGEVIALTDSSCVVSNYWASSILSAHNGKWPVIGGAVDIAGNKKLVSWAAYFCDYGQFMSSVHAGVVSAVPGNNISIKRAALKIGSEFVENEFWKTHWCRSLQANGIELFLDPSIVVRCDKKYEPAAFLIRRFHQGRCFAAIRSMQMSALKRLMFAAGTAVLPLLLMLRIATPVMREKRFWGKFLLSLPVIFAASVIWSAGEGFGYLTGRGTSSDRID